MIVMLAVGVPAGFKTAQALCRDELGKDQNDQMIPAGEGFDPRIRVVTLGNLSEAPAIEGFQQVWRRW